MNDPRLTERPLLRPARKAQELVGLDIAQLSGANTRVELAKVRGEGSDNVYCEVDAYVAPAVRFKLRLPQGGWNQRFMMLGRGGYGGTIYFDTWPGTCVNRAVSEPQWAVAATDSGHRTDGKMNDCLWAVGNPQAVVDLAYEATHKVAIAAKAIIEFYYDAEVAFSYFAGCSSGGRQALHQVQRYADDFDGVVAVDPTIDMVGTNTFWHAWNARTNMDENGYAILTADKIPFVHEAVLRAAADQDAALPGAIRDPRGMVFDAHVLADTSFPERQRLTSEQADVVNKIHEGPTDDRGRRLFPRGNPYGSELAWVGAMIPNDGTDEINESTSVDFAYSLEFSNYLSSFDIPTGITNANIKWDEECFVCYTNLQGSSTLPTLIYPASARPVASYSSGRAGSTRSARRTAP